MEMKTDKDKTGGNASKPKTISHSKNTNSSSKEAVPGKKLQASTAKPKTDAFWNRLSKPQNARKPLKSAIVNVLQCKQIKPENQQLSRTSNKQDIQYTAKTRDTHTNYKEREYIKGSTEKHVVLSTTSPLKTVDSDRGKLKRKEQVKGSTEECVVPSKSLPLNKVCQNKGNLKQEEQIKRSTETCVVASTSLPPKKLCPNKIILHNQKHVKGSKEECVLPSISSVLKKGNLNKGNLKKKGQIESNTGECFVSNTSAALQKTDLAKGNLNKKGDVKGNREECIVPSKKQVRGSKEECAVLNSSAAVQKTAPNKISLNKKEHVEGSKEKYATASKKANMNRKPLKARAEIILGIPGQPVNVQKTKTNKPVRQTGFKATCNSAQVAKIGKIVEQKEKVMGKVKCHKTVPKAELEEEEPRKIISLTRSAAKLLQDGPQKFEGCPPTAVQGCLTRHKTILRQFIDVIACSQDVKERITATELMFVLLVPHKTVHNSKSWDIESSLDCIDNFTLLVDNMYVMDVKFRDCEAYQEALPELYVKMVHIIAALSSVDKFQQEMLEIDRNTIHFLSELFAENTRKDVAQSLLSLCKIICSKKTNCHYLSNPSFYNALYNNFQLAKQPVIMTSVLQLLSRSRVAFREMVKQESVIKLMLELLVNHNKTVSKVTLLNILYKTTEHEHGRSLLSKSNSVNKLYNFFTTDSSLRNELQCIIKCYAILNRSIKRVPLPSFKKTVLGLPRAVYKHLGVGKICVNNRLNNTGRDDKESSSSKKDRDALRYFIKTLPRKPKPSRIKTHIGMKHLYTEFFENCDSKYKNFLKKFNKKGVPSLKEKIIRNIHRPKSKNKWAYPDCSMLEATCEKYIVKSTCNQLPLGHLGFMFGCARETVQRSYVSHTVYDLDDCTKRPSTVNLPEFGVVDAPDILNQIRNNSLQFDSQFESGNLQQAIQIDKYEYELLLSPDTMTDNGHQWFYFCISNVVSTMIYHFHIINFIRPKNMYNDGMKPLMFSVKEHQLHGTGWKRAGENIIYYGNRYTDEAGELQYRSLSLTMTFPHDNDHVYLASHYPYTYTRLMVVLAPLIQSQPNVYTRVDRLCQSVTNMNVVPVVTITADLNNSSLPIKKRPIVFITSRVHSGESNSSWIMEGIIKYLTNSTDEYAVTAREHFVFKIIPMLNPEGVIYGNCRRGLVGYDLNRCWEEPNEFTCPTIFYTKQLVKYATEMGQPIAAFIDIHGHSRQKSFFFYGCNPTNSWNEHDARWGNCLNSIKLLPEAISTLNRHISLDSCSYRVCRYKEAAARIVMWREFHITHSFTLECSYCQGSSGRSVDTKMLTNIGASIVGGLAKIVIGLRKFKGSLPSMQIIFHRKKQKKPKVKDLQKRFNLYGR